MSAGDQTHICQLD